MTHSKHNISLKKEFPLIYFEENGISEWRGELLYYRALLDIPDKNNMFYCEYRPTEKDIKNKLIKSLSRLI